MTIVSLRAITSEDFRRMTFFSHSNMKKEKARWEREWERRSMTSRVYVFERKCFVLSIHASHCSAREVEIDSVSLTIAPNEFEKGKV